MINLALKIKLYDLYTVNLIIGFRQWTDDRWQLFPI